MDNSKQQINKPFAPVTNSLAPSGVIVEDAPLEERDGVRGCTISFLIGAATSNSGKTTFTMGLLRALRNRGYNVQPYKCGPDYIDTMFHHLASGNESVNLDTFMSGGEHTKNIFSDYGEHADIKIVEGVMGLFDGYDKMQGSSAEIAMLLDIPVILVVNAKSVAYSVAPLIHGFKTFNPAIRIAGVVFNMVASENHFRFLKDACEDAHVPCLGYLQKNPDLNIPGRHLGLTISAREEMESLINLAAEEVEKHVDLDMVLAQKTLCLKTLSLRTLSPTLSLKGKGDQQHSHPDGSPLPLGRAGRESLGRRFGRESSVIWSISIARDEAFNFTYKANIDALSRLGSLKYFSPLKDKELPPCDLLYLPGGYPELFIDQLSSNTTMLESIRSFAENGGHIFAECGGFMYLCHDIDGKTLCNVFPFHATMQNAHLHLGYRTMQWKGRTVKGHEFHYSEVTGQEMPDTISAEHLQYSAKGTPVSTPLYHYKNVFAGYTHWYWADEGFPFL